MLPHGYTVCIILSFIPPVWFRICNPIADAVNKNEKVSIEVMRNLEKWMHGTLFLITCIMTYLCFYVVGFHPY